MAPRGGPALDDIRTHTGTLVLDLILPLSNGLKDRRKRLHSLQDRLSAQDFAVAQVGPADRPQRAFLAVGVVSGSASKAEERLDLAERIAFESEFEIRVLSRDLTTWSGSSLT